MSRLPVCTILGAVTTLLFCASSFADWQAWRGPTGDGVAPPSAQPPLEWGQGGEGNAATNVVWKCDLPGRGHSSPVVAGGRVYLTTCDEAEQTLLVLAIDADSGEIIWKREVHQGGLPKKIHAKNTHASPTLAYRDGRLFSLFHREDAVDLSCLDAVSGEILWQVRPGSFTPKYEFGYAPSPCLFKDLVIVSAESSPDGFLAAYHQKTGQPAWRTPRADGTSYSSPIVTDLGGRPQLLISGFLRIDAFDPETGKPLWKGPGPASATCGTLVSSPLLGLVFASGGYPQKATVAVAPPEENGQPGTEIWRNKEKSYEQSMLLHENHLYTLNDAGFAVCWDARTGEEKWKERLRGPVSASPILAAGKIHALDERGATHVFAPDPDEFRLLATNQLGEEGFATPAFVGTRIYYRTARGKGTARIETLYCLGK